MLWSFSFTIHLAILVLSSIKYDKRKTRLLHCLKDVDATVQTDRKTFAESVIELVKPFWKWESAVDCNQIQMLRHPCLTKKNAQLRKRHKFGFSNLTGPTLSSKSLWYPCSTNLVGQIEKTVVQNIFQWYKTSKMCHKLNSKMTPIRKPEYCMSKKY